MAGILVYFCYSALDKSLGVGLLNLSNIDNIGPGYFTQVIVAFKGKWPPSLLSQYLNGFQICVIFCRLGSLSKEFEQALYWRGFKERKCWERKMHPSGSISRKCSSSQLSLVPHLHSHYSHCTQEANPLVCS